MALEPEIEIKVSCKVCDILNELDETEAKDINAAILSRGISTNTAALILSKHVRHVGATTVRLHRDREHVI